MMFHHLKKHKESSYECVTVVLRHSEVTSDSFICTNSFPTGSLENIIIYHLLISFLYLCFNNKASFVLMCYGNAALL